MRVPLVLYKKSALANVFSIGGFILVFIGIYALRCREMLPAFLCAGVGILLILLSNTVHDKVQERKKRKLLNDPSLIKTVSNSASQAFYLFQKIPEQKVLEFIYKHNPYAANIIIKTMKKELGAEAAINLLREYDMKRN